jgi:hypothetical protein
MALTMVFFAKPRGVMTKVTGRFMTKVTESVSGVQGPFTLSDTNEKRPAKPPLFLALDEFDLFRSISARN